MKKNRDEKILTIIHTYMEIPQGNSLCSSLKQAKCHFFHLLNQRTGGQKRSCLGRGTIGSSGRAEDVGEGCRRGIWYK
jgi:hypothetical protein